MFRSYRDRLCKFTVSTEFLKSQDLRISVDPWEYSVVSLALVRLLVVPVVGFWSLWRPSRLLIVLLILVTEQVSERNTPSIENW